MRPSGWLLGGSGASGALAGVAVGFGLGEDVVGDGDDGAAAFLGLDDVEDLAGAGPEEFGLGLGVQEGAETNAC